MTGNAIWVVVTFLQNLNSEHSRNASYFTYLDIDTYTCYYYASLLFKQSWISTVCPQHIHVFPVVLSKFYLNAWIYGFMCLLSICVHVCVHSAAVKNEMWRVHPQQPKCKLHLPLWPLCTRTSLTSPPFRYSFLTFPHCVQSDSLLYLLRFLWYFVLSPAQLLTVCTTCLSACLAPTFLKLLPFANISQIAGIRRIILQYVNVFSFEKKLKWKIGELVRKASSH